MKRSKINLPLAATILAVTILAVPLGIAPTAHAAGRDVTDEVKARIAALNLKPRTIELTSEKALRARNAIKHDDFATADEIIAAALKQSRVETWRFFPFSDLIDAIPDVNDRDFEAHLTAWVARNEKDAMPLLVRAAFLQSKAWLERGSNFVSETPAARMAAFGTLIERSRTAVEAAIRLDGGNPYSFQLWLKILRGHGFTDDMIRAFEAGIAKYPGYYPLYPAMLVVLQPKWAR